MNESKECKELVRDQEQTISRLRSTIERIRKQRYELLYNEELLQAEIIVLREYNEEQRERLEALCVSHITLHEARYEKLKAQLPVESSLEWAISQMRLGKKVRLGTWGDNFFLTPDAEGYIVDESHNRFGTSISTSGTWQLYEEPKKELCAGQVWFDEYDNTYEIIGIRGDIVSYYYQDNREPCSVSVENFKYCRAHKLLGDA